MREWKLHCPNCGAANTVSSSQLELDCGKISCALTCPNCQTSCQVVQDYWRWLGLEQEPQQEAASE